MSSPSPNDREDQSSLRRQLPLDVQREKTLSLSLSNLAKNIVS